MGLFLVTKRASELNYELTDQNGKNQVVHINRLKKAYDADLRKPKTRKTQSRICLKREFNAQKRMKRPSYRLDPSHYHTQGARWIKSKLILALPNYPLGRQRLITEIQIITPQRHQNHNVNSKPRGTHLQSLVL